MSASKEGRKEGGRNSIDKIMVRYAIILALPLYHLKVKVKVKSLSHVRLCNPMDYSLPGFSVHGIFQAIVIEWIAISFSRGSSRPRD